MTYKSKDNIDEPIIKIYPYGSHLYGTNKKDSDFDYIVIVESDTEISYNITNRYTDYTVYSKSKFIRLIREHDITALECIFQNDNDEYVKYFELNLPKLRRAISSSSSNSYVKCKKKMYEGEHYIGKKSMFHSLRILIFGIQIAKYGKIIDYSQANRYYDNVFSLSDDWNDIHKVFKPEYNYLKKTFRTLAPLEEIF